MSTVSPAARSRDAMRQAPIPRRLTTENGPGRQRRTAALAVGPLCARGGKPSPSQPMPELSTPAVNSLCMNQPGGGEHVDVTPNLGRAEEGDDVAAAEGGNDASHGRSGHRAASSSDSYCIVVQRAIQLRVLQSHIGPNLKMMLTSETEQRRFDATRIGSRYFQISRCRSVTKLSPSWSLVALLSAAVQSAAVSRIRRSRTACARAS